MKQLKNTLVLFLVLALTLCSLASCSGGKAAMRYGDQELSEADYAYLMAFFKGYYENYYAMMASQYGQTIDLSQLYDNKVSDDKTFAQALTETVNDAAKMMLVVEQLCKEAGLTVTDPESLDDISKAIQELEDSYGGSDALVIEMAKLGLKRSSIERYENYNLLLSLLKDYRYGENGVARISAEEVRKAFDEDYVKAEGFLYSYIVTDSNGKRAMYQYDFASDYSEEEVAEYFAAHFLKLSYLQFEKQEDAQKAYDQLIAGEAKPEAFFETAEKHAVDSYFCDAELEETLLETVLQAEEGKWSLSEKIGTSYYVISRSASAADDLKDDVVKSVRNALVDRDARVYYNENYVTVRHILYSDEEKAKQVFADIQSGKTTFAEHEFETKDSGVQYSFTKGTMVDEFEDAAYAMEIGSYQLVKTQYGWHLMTRLELDPKGYDQEDTVCAMSRDLLRADAQEQYNALVAGKIQMEKPTGDALYSYSEPSVLKLQEQDEVLRKALADAKPGEYLFVDLDSYGVFVLQKQETNDEDLEKVYDDVEDPLVQNAFYSYLESFFDNVVTDQKVLDQFNIRTAKSFYF